MTSVALYNELKSSFSQQFCQDVLVGLGSNSKRLSPKYFYDSRGSILFEKICNQPEYYPTRTEAAILRNDAAAIAKVCEDKQSVIVELGSGSSSKTRILLDEIQRQTEHACYFPIDISHSAILSSTSRLSEEFPRMKVVGLVAEYLDGIGRALEICDRQNISARKLVTFFGSSIGNFEPDEAAMFLSTVSSKLNDGDMMLVGFDLQKDIEILNAAYNDRAGVTADFNLNLLHRINRELGGEFDTRLFTHNAFYNKRRGRVEMHLVSACNQDVYIRETGRRFGFSAGESIHTESSYKYTIAQINSLARRCELNVRKHFTDGRKWFDLVLFERSGRLF